MDAVNVAKRNDRGWEMVLYKLVPAVLLVLAVGCSPKTVITAQGPYRDGDLGSQYARFADLYDKASKASAARDPVNDELLRAGLSLVANNCSDFFRNEGRLQQSLAVVRDSINAVIPLATGAIGLVKVAGNAVAILSLSQAGATSTINIVAANFLFGAENIEDVRVLTANALASHGNAVLGLRKTALDKGNDVENTGYDWVLQQILDSQEICKAPKILALAKEAIAKGNAKAYASATLTPVVPQTQSPPSVGASVAPRSMTFAAPAPAAFLPGVSTPRRVGVRIEN